MMPGPPWRGGMPGGGRIGITPGGGGGNRIPETQWKVDLIVWYKSSIHLIFLNRDANSLQNLNTANRNHENKKFL